MAAPGAATGEILGPGVTQSLERRCDLLRSLHRPGVPLLLPNAWDVATARAVVAAGYPAVATTSGGIAATLGFDDHERAPPARCSPRRPGSRGASRSR